MRLLRLGSAQFLKSDVTNTHKAEIYLFLLTYFKNKLTGESNEYPSYQILCVLFFFQTLYGRLGFKPNKYMIELYERYTLGKKVFRESSLSQLFQVTVSRYVRIICFSYDFYLLFSIHHQPRPPN